MTIVTETVYKEKKRVLSSQFPVSRQGGAWLSLFALHINCSLWVATAFQHQPLSEETAPHSRLIAKAVEVQSALRGVQWHCFLTAWFQLQTNPSFPPFLQPPPPRLHLNFLQSLFFHLRSYRFYVCAGTTYLPTWRVASGKSLCAHFTQACNWPWGCSGD